MDGMLPLSSKDGIDSPLAEQRKRQTHKTTRWAQLQKKTEILVAKVSVVKVTANSVVALVVAVSYNAYCVVTTCSACRSPLVLSLSWAFTCSHLLSPWVLVNSLSLPFLSVWLHFQLFMGRVCLLSCFARLRIRQQMLKIREKQKKNTETRLVMRAGPELWKKSRAFGRTFSHPNPIASISGNAFVRSCVRSGWLWNGTDSLSRERKQNKNIETRRPSRDSRTVDLRFRGTGKMQSRVLARIVFERFRLPSSKVGRNIPRKLFPFVIQDVEGGKFRRSRSKVL